MPGPITVWSHTDHRTRITGIPLARLSQVVADRDRGSPCALLGAAMLQGRVRHHAGRRAVV